MARKYLSQYNFVNSYTFWPKNRYYEKRVKITSPQRFRIKKHAFRIKPTPGGRWKVRKLIEGGWLAYVEAQGTASSQKYLMEFPSQAMAVNYAMAQASICRFFKGKLAVRQDAQHKIFCYHRYMVENPKYHH